jgi:hypothetical protein
LPDGHALTGFAHEYKRHGTTTLFAALAVASGQVQTGRYSRRRRREFLDFIMCLPSSAGQDRPGGSWATRHPRIRARSASGRVAGSAIY